MAGEIFRAARRHGGTSAVRMKRYWRNRSETRTFAGRRVIYSPVMNRVAHVVRGPAAARQIKFLHARSAKNRNYTSVGSSRCNFIDGSPGAGLMNFPRTRRPTFKSWPVSRRQGARDERTSPSRVFAFGGGVVVVVVG